MKKLFFILIWLIINGQLFAQEYSKEFGKIGTPEILLNCYSKDTTAVAVILFDIGETVFVESDNGYNIRFTRSKRIKILNKSALEFAEVSIPYYYESREKTEVVNSIEAITYNFENGQLVSTPLDSRAVYDEIVNDRWKVRKFAFPNVKEGSIIEYRYVLESPFHFNLPDWKFQDKIPTIYSYYSAALIPFYEYIFLAKGITKFDYHKTRLSNDRRVFGSITPGLGSRSSTGFEFNDNIHEFAMNHVPAFINEGYITSEKDYLMSVVFQLARFHSPYGGTTEIITTWPKLSSELLNHERFGKYLKNAGSYAKKFLDAKIQHPNKTTSEKCSEIIHLVRNEFNWNGRFSKFASQTPKDLITKKSGNSSDINLFLIALLNSAGIKAAPTIISTRGNGKIYQEYPFESFFNNVIVWVTIGDESFITDGTDNYLPYNRIPPYCLNHVGLILDAKEPHWVTLENDVQSIDRKFISLSLDIENLTSDVNVILQTSEYESYSMKKQFNNDYESIKKYLIDNGFVSVEKLQTKDYERYEFPYIIEADGKAEIEQINERVIISPFLNFPMKENPFKQKQRSYPVDFSYLRTENFQSQINIPEGYKVLSHPEEFEMNNELAHIKCNYLVNDNKFILSAEYIFKKTAYKPTEYTRIKSYFDSIIKKFNEPIVLEKL